MGSWADRETQRGAVRSGSLQYDTVRHVHRRIEEQNARGQPDKRRLSLGHLERLEHRRVVGRDPVRHATQIDQVQNDRWAGYGDPWSGKPPCGAARRRDHLGHRVDGTDGAHHRDSMEQGGTRGPHVRREIGTTKFGRLQPDAKGPVPQPIAPVRSPGNPDAGRK